MPSLNQARQSNAQLRASREELVAVFPGGTSGIGAATAKRLAKSVKKPTIILVGRNGILGSKMVDELKSLNRDGTYHFIQADLTLLKNVDKACAEISEKELPIDLLFMSMGHLATSRKDTSEGLENNHVLRYYGRMRFVTNLLPLLSESKAPRVVTVLGAGKEGKIEEDNLDLSKSFSLPIAASYSATMSSLAVEHLASQYPAISFIHVFPGIVRTPLARSSFGAFIGTIFGVLSWPIAMSSDESGERNLFISSSAAYPAAKVGEYSGVPLVQGVQTVASSTGQTGGGSYILNYDGKDATQNGLMQECREKELVSKVWSHTEETFKKALSSSS